MSSAEEIFSTSSGIFQAFGQIYFSIKKLSRKTVNKFPTLYYTIYFVIIFTALTSQMALFVYLASIDNPEALSAKTALNFIVQNLVLVGLILILWVAFIQSYAATPKLKRIFINFIEISNLFRHNFQHNVDYKCSQRWLFKIVIYFYLTYIFSQLAVVSYERYYGDESSIYRAVTGTIPTSLIAIVAIKYTFLITLINQILNQMIIVFEKMFKKIELNGVVIVSENHGNFNAKIRNLRKIYLLVNESVELINKSMGHTMLTMVFVLVLGLITSVYKMFLALVGRLETDKKGGKNISILFQELKIDPNLFSVMVLVFIQTLIILCSIVKLCNQTQKLVSFLKHKLILINNYKISRSTSLKLALIKLKLK